MDTVVNQRRDSSADASAVQSLSAPQTPIKNLCQFSSETLAAFGAIQYNRIKSEFNQAKTTSSQSETVVEISLKNLPVDEQRAVLKGMHDALNADLKIDSRGRYTGYSPGLEMALALFKAGAQMTTHDFSLAYHSYSKNRDYPQAGEQILTNELEINPSEKPIINGSHQEYRTKIVIRTGLEVENPKAALAALDLPSILPQFKMGGSVPITHTLRSINDGRFAKISFIENTRETLAATLEGINTLGDLSRLRAELQRQYLKHFHVDSATAIENQVNFILAAAIARECSKELQKLETGFAEASSSAREERVVMLLNNARSLLDDCSSVASPKSNLDAPLRSKALFLSDVSGLVAACVAICSRPISDKHGFEQLLTAYRICCALDGDRQHVPGWVKSKLDQSGPDNANTMPSRWYREIIEPMLERRVSDCFRVGDHANASNLLTAWTYRAPTEKEALRLARLNLQNGKLEEAELFYKLFDQERHPGKEREPITFKRIRRAAEVLASNGDGESLLQLERALQKGGYLFKDKPIQFSPNFYAKSITRMLKNDDWRGLSTLALARKDLGIKDRTHSPDGSLVEIGAELSADQVYFLIRLEPNYAGSEQLKRWAFSQSAPLTPQHIEFFFPHNSLSPSEAYALLIGDRSPEGMLEILFSGKQSNSRFNPYFAMILNDRRLISDLINAQDSNGMAKVAMIAIVMDAPLKNNPELNDIVQQKRWVAGMVMENVISHTDFTSPSAASLVRKTLAQIINYIGAANYLHLLNAAPGEEL